MWQTLSICTQSLIKSGCDSAILKFSVRKHEYFLEIEDEKKNISPKFLSLASTIFFKRGSYKS